jgi:signal transduction histidine kinase
LALAQFSVGVGAMVLFVWAEFRLDDVRGVTHPFWTDFGELVGAATAAGIGLALSWLRPHNPIGWLISASGVALAVCILGQSYGALALTDHAAGLPLGTWSLSLSAPLWLATVFFPVSVVLGRYPSGELSGRWARGIDRAAWGGLGALYAGYATSAQSVTDEMPHELPPILLPEAISSTLLYGGLTLTLASSLGVVVLASVRAIKGERAERMALVWLLTSSVAAVALIFFSPNEWLGSVAHFGVLGALAIGVLRYRALGIEVAVRRALVYSILTGLVLLVFAGTVTALATVLPHGSIPQLVAAAVIAVGLAPARERIQRLINRFLYGSRDDPLAALRQLGSPMGGASSENQVAEVLAALVAALRIEGAVITRDDGIPLVFGGREVGRLLVQPRRGETELGKADLRLLESIAPLVAAVLHAVALAEDLDVERTRVLEATQAERNRLRQELHDGLGPSLTGIGLGLEAAARHPDEVLLTRLRSEVSTCLEDVRRIIDDLRPTALDNHGLVGALRLRAEQLGTVLRIDFEAPDELPQVPPGVAGAAYRIADEALTNVVRHARATTCSLRLAVDRELLLEVRDDGVGPGVARAEGLGLISMRERAERWGGRFELRTADPGTLVRVALPLETS